MDGPSEYHTKQSKREKYKYYMWKVKNKTNESTYKRETNS